MNKLTKTIFIKPKKDPLDLWDFLNKVVIEIVIMFLCVIVVVISLTGGLP